MRYSTYIFHHHNSGQSDLVTLLVWPKRLALLGDGFGDFYDRYVFIKVLFLDQVYKLSSFLPKLKNISQTSR